MKKAISKINPSRYAKKLHISYIWLIAVLLLLVVGIICSGAKVYKYSPILSVVSYSLAAISLIAIIIMTVRKISDMKIQSELDKYILVLNEHKDDQEWLHKELTYVNQNRIKRERKTIKPFQKMTLRCEGHNLSLAIFFVCPSLSLGVQG